MRRIVVMTVLALALALGLVLGAMAVGETVSADPTPGNFVQLPVLGFIANQSTGVDFVIEAQNVGATFTKVALLLFQENQGFCPPQVARPFKLECSGLLKPGSAWIFTSQGLPRAAKSAIAFSFNPFPAYNSQYYRCEDIDALRRTRDWPEGWPGVFPTIGGTVNFNVFNGEPIAVEVVRKAPGNVNPSLVMASAYSGIGQAQEGRFDPLFGGFAYYAPQIYSGFLGFNTWLYIQNSGFECTSVELWFQAQGDCLRSQICEILQLAPGYTAQFNASTCVPPGFVGSVWIRASQPLGIVVDKIGPNVLLTYTGVAAELCFVFNGACLDQGGGSTVAYGPLIFREQHGWDTRVTVQNLSSIVAAKVKVYFLDHTGGIITTLVDWVCPRGSGTFFLPLVNNLPGNYVGQIRVESQAWESPGDPFVNAVPIAAVADLIQYSNASRTTPLQGIAYNLFPQEQGYVWQIGAGQGGLQSGVGLIGIPSLLQRGNQLGITTELAITNLVPKPGKTDFAIFVYDQNGLIDYVCEALNEKQVEYIMLENWGWIQPGFKGSAVISATFWEHDVFSATGGFLRNVVGLAAVKIERVVPSGNLPIPGDLAAGSEGFPIPPIQTGQRPNFHFEGFPPVCPGVPAACSPVILVLTICPPNTTTGISTYTGAPVTVRDQNGTVIFAGFVNAQGQVVVGTVTSGGPFQVTVGPVLQPVPFPGGNVDFIEMAGFTQNFVVPCTFDTGAGLLQVSEVTVTPPPGVIEGYLLVACTPTGQFPGLPVRVGREVQLWIPPSNPENQGGTLLASKFTGGEGYFDFRGLNPCIVYELKIPVGTFVTVTRGVLAGAEVTTIGTPGVGQKYFISDATGLICDVEPDPPGPGLPNAIP